MDTELSAFLANTPEALHGSYLKVIRARHHIDDLKAKIDSFLFDMDNYEVFVYADTGSPNDAVHCRLNVPIPHEFSLITGDACFNLISALDHAYIALVELAGNTRDTGDQFPIKKEFSALKGSMKRGIKDRIGFNACRTILKYIRPYRSSGKIGGNNFICNLKVIRNFDGHNFLVPVGSAAMSAVFTSQNGVVLNPFGAVSDMLGWTGSLYDGIPIGTRSMCSFDEDGRPNEKPHRVFGSITFGEIKGVEHLAGKDIISSLQYFSDEVIMSIDILQQASFLQNLPVEARSN